MSAAILGGCSSAAGPGADGVLKQVDKAKQVEKQVEERNSGLDQIP